MGYAHDELMNLKQQINSGFLISAYDYDKEKDWHCFIIPGLGRDWNICIPDCPEILEYMDSKVFKDSLMVKKKYGVILIDLIGFSQLPIEFQLKMVVRYQCELRRAIRSHESAIERYLSIGDGTVLLFDESNIHHMLDIVISIDDTLKDYNATCLDADKPIIKKRIGVHIDYLYKYKDINKDINYVGPAINIAQRVSTCVPDLGDNSKSVKEKSSIYVSREAFEKFSKLNISSKYLFFNLGLRDVKHGKIHIYALHKRK